jgi:hypothetical protein
MLQPPFERNIALFGGISMAIDRSNFLLVAGALAAGGAGGWIVHEQRANRPTVTATTESAKPKPALPEGPVPVALAEPMSGAAVCDDAMGISDECPSVGPSDEGGCANVILKRCTDFKSAFKPRVAQLAVACLRQLKANERCDAARINLCGHAALMAACPEPAPPVKATLEPATTTTPVRVSLAADPALAASPLVKTCESIVKACSSQPLGPTASDCRQTLVGMTETGRALTAECAAAHCADRGLLGCEAQARAPTALVR